MSSTDDIEVLEAVPGLRIQREGEGVQTDVSGQGQGEFPGDMRAASWSSLLHIQECSSLEPGAVKCPGLGSGWRHRAWV